MLLLSGGLDSSILLFCWASAATELLAATFYGTDPGADERPYARIATEAACCKHIELPVEQHADLKEWSTAAVSPRPGHLLTLAQQKRMRELARETGATAVVTGDGGDASFFQVEDIRIAADFVRDHGLQPSAAKVIMATAIMTETSVWAVTGEALKGVRWRRRPNVNILLESVKHRKLVSASARETFAQNIDRYAPSYMREGLDLPSAKFAHVWMLAQPMPCRSVLADWEDPVYVNPYTDELVKEFCLSTPLYIHCREGWGRWLPRVAFAGEVPASLLQRVAKGRPESQFHAWTERQLPELRDRLLGGELVKRGILDRRTVEVVLRGKRVQSRAWELLEAYALEEWAATVTREHRGAIAA